MSNPLLNTPAEILRAAICQPSGSLFTDPTVHPGQANPLMVSSLPDQPDSCGSIYDTQGIVAGRLLASGRVIQKYGLQIRARGTDYGVVFRSLAGVAYTLARIKRMPLTVAGNSFVIDSVMQTSPVISMGQDLKRRPECSVNLLLMLVEAV